MDLDKILTIFKIVMFIAKNEECLVLDIESNFNVPTATLYRYLDSWESKNYVKKTDLGRLSKKQYLITALPKIKQFINKILVENLKYLARSDKWYEEILIYLEKRAKNGKKISNN